MSKQNNELSSEQSSQLLKTLKTRFEENMNRHAALDWAKVEEKLKSDSACLLALNKMEETGGEPDLVAFDKISGKYIFVDCSAESPKGRRSLCYDQAALEARKEHKPKSSALEMAAFMGIELLNESEYRELQKLGDFDTKTSSWIKTPDEIRRLGGAVFCDRRYNTVFVYHNGAESYYAARGFRGKIEV